MPNYIFSNDNNEIFVFDEERGLIFSEENYKELDIVQDEIKIDDFRSKCFSNVSFIMNNMCNLACEYCYANKGSFDKHGEKLDFETAKSVIDTMYSQIIKNNKERIKIGFFGGEPLLSFSLIRKIVEYVIEKNSIYNLCVKFSVVTNGTLFNDEIIDFFMNHNFDIVLSIDGSKEVHDRVRKYMNGSGSFDVISSNIKKYLNKIKFTARLTVNDGNTDLVDSVNAILNLGIKNILIGVDSGMSDENYKKFMDSYQILINQYLSDIKNGKIYCLDNIVTKLIRIISRKKSSVHCGAGIGSFAVSADKKIYYCHRLVGTKQGYICDIEEQYGEKIEKFIQKMELEVSGGVGNRVLECKNCL